MAKQNNGSWLKRMKREDTFLLGIVRTGWNSTSWFNWVERKLLNQHVFPNKSNWNCSSVEQCPPDWLGCESRGFIFEFLERSQGLEKQMWFLAGLGLCVETPVGLCPGLLQHCWHFGILMELLFSGQYGLPNRETSCISWYQVSALHCQW